jgi:hypothetical protein
MINHPKPAIKMPALFFSLKVNFEKQLPSITFDTLPPFINRENRSEYDKNNISLNKAAHE